MLPTKCGKREHPKVDQIPINSFPTMLEFLIFDWGNTLMRDFTQYEGAMAFWPQIEVISGVTNTLRNLQKHYTLCVATNAGISDTALMRKALERGGIESYFSFYYSSKDLGYSKPDIHFFEEILKKSGFVSDKAVMIGNDYSKDIIGAKQVGLKTILFNELKTPGNYKYADIVISCFEETISAIDELNKK